MISILKTDSGAVVKEIAHAHESPINRILVLGTAFKQVATGDDDGVVKIWDTQKLALEDVESPLRSYVHHTDYISDFCWLEDKKHLVATSGDGTLSVMDVRSTKATPLAQSEDQEDELLSIVPIKGGKRLAVGTQLGPITIFDRKRGYGDCIDRFLGHPHSVETLAVISGGSQLTQDVVATGSSDGLIRVVQLLPSKFLGVIAAHGNSQDEESPGEGFPVERIKVDRNGKWLGSISHDDVLKLTDIEGALEGSDEEDAQESDEQAEERERIEQSEESDDEFEPKAATPRVVPQEVDNAEEASDSSSLPPKESRAEKKRRKKQMKREEAKRQKRARDGAATRDRKSVV